MNEFKKEDVLTLARVITDDPVITNLDDYSILWFTCKYCNTVLQGYNGSIEDFKHELSCPVLIAQDILTRNT